MGNVMIDALTVAAGRARPSRAAAADSAGHYTMVTLHRPNNVDYPDTLGELLDSLTLLAMDGPVLFPVHPRTRAQIGRLNGKATLRGVRFLEPLPYLEMLGLISDAALVVTDSGGLQEETTWLGVPCVTVRPTTERPITCTAGTNRLAPPPRGDPRRGGRRLRAERPATPPVLERWDGRTGSALRP